MLKDEYSHKFIYKLNIIPIKNTHKLLYSVRQIDTKFHMGKQTFKISKETLRKKKYKEGTSPTRH